MTLILAHKNRKLTRDITVQDAAGSTVTPGSNDVVRVKIGRRGQTPLLDLDSVATSGSRMRKNYPTSGTNRLEVEQVDMNLLEPGVYTLEASLVDNADGQAIKHVDNQVLVVSGTMTGDVGLT